MKCDPLCAPVFENDPGGIERIGDLNATDSRSEVEYFRVMYGRRYSKAKGTERRVAVSSAGSGFGQRIGVLCGSSLTVMVRKLP